MGYINGNGASAAIKGALILLGIMILCITAIVIADKTVPAEFTAFMATVSGALVGFLAGSRVVPPDVSQDIRETALKACGKEIESADH